MACACGARHTVCVSERGGMHAFGAGSYGQLGRGWGGQPDSPCPASCLLGQALPVVQVAAGDYHTAAVTAGGEVRVCGNNGDGQLGLGDDESRSALTPLGRGCFAGARAHMVACGGAHTAVLTDTGAVWTFGGGGNGQLGLGNRRSCSVPAQVCPEHFRVDPRFKDPRERIVMLAAGRDHTVAQSEEGSVFTWGCGESGRLGHNDEEDQLSPRRLGRLFADATVVYVAAGGGHTLAVSDDGQLWAWGCNKHGQLGHGSTSNVLVPSLVEGFARASLVGAAVMMAACGARHSLVLTRDATVWAAGRGAEGQLGLKRKRDSLVFVCVGADPFRDVRVATVAAGLAHSAAVTEDGGLWTWGRGAQGALGHGDVAERPVPALVAPASLADERVGRCRRLPAECALAFAMSQHERLGAGRACAAAALGETELVRKIVDLCRYWPEGSAAGDDGAARLMGGYGVRAVHVHSSTTPLSAESEPFYSSALVALVDLLDDASEGSSA